MLITLLNDIMGADLEESVARQRALGIVALDLKSDVFGRAIEDLEAQHRLRLAALLSQSDVSVYCLSSSLGRLDAATTSERAFRPQLEAGVANLAATLEVVSAQLVRLFACPVSGHGTSSSSAASELPRWVVDAYADAIAQLNAQGVDVTIETEPDSALRTPSNVLDFFSRLRSRSQLRVGFTWDVQNMWVAGARQR